MRVQFCDCTLFCFLRFEYDNANQIAKPIRKIGLLSQVLGFARRRWIVYWFTMTLFPGRRWLLWYSSFPCSVTISSVCRLSRPPPARRSPSRTKLLRELLWRKSNQSKALIMNWLHSCNTIWIGVAWLLEPLQINVELQDLRFPDFFVEREIEETSTMQV